MGKLFDRISDIKAKGAGPQVNNYIRNIFADVIQYVRYITQFPKSVHIVPDFFIQVHKLSYDYQKFSQVQESGLTTSEIRSDAVKDFVFQINDVRTVKTRMSSSGAIGTASFVLNQRLLDLDVNLINTPIKEDNPFEVSWDFPDLKIDKMDIVKIFERNRFDDNYSVIFTGMITSIQKVESPRADLQYNYVAGDVSTALRLSTQITTPSLVQLLRDGNLAPELKKQIIWDNPIKAGQNADEIIKRLVEDSWYIYPGNGQITETTAIPTTSFTRVEVENPQSLGILNLNVFPDNFRNTRAYGNVFKNFRSLSFFQSREKNRLDLIRELAESTGFEFYATQEGNFNYGIPRYDIDIDGAYYRFSPQAPDLVERVGFYDLNGKLNNTELPNEAYSDEADIYTINPEDLISYEDLDTLDNIFTRVDVTPTDFTQDILNAKSFLLSTLGEQLHFSFPDFQFESPDAFNPEDEKFKDLVRYGMRFFKTGAKPFLITDEAVKAYAQFIYNKLRGARITATISILPRPEMKHGRTIRIPYKNIIAYAPSITHSVIAKKTASTLLTLTFVRSTDLPTPPAEVAGAQTTKYEHDDDPSAIESKYGSFTPAGTFDFTNTSQ